MALVLSCLGKIIRGLHPFKESAARPKKRHYDTPPPLKELHPITAMLGLVTMRWYETPKIDNSEFRPLLSKTKLNRHVYDRELVLMGDGIPW